MVAMGECPVEADVPHDVEQALSGTATQLRVMQAQLRPVTCPLSHHCGKFPKVGDHGVGRR